MGSYGDVGDGLGPLDSQPVGSNLLPISTYYGVSLTVFELTSWPQNVSARPPVRLGYDDNYNSRSCCFVERKKNITNMLTPWFSEC